MLALHIALDDVWSKAVVLCIYKKLLTLLLHIYDDPTRVHNTSTVLLRMDIILYSTV